MEDMQTRLKYYRFKICTFFRADFRRKEVTALNV